MPNYEYECTQCAHRFEVWQSVGEAAPACEQCQSEVKKVFHVPRVIFKGSGFYVTDLRAEKGGNSSTGGGGSSKSSTSTSSAATTETKTETATKTDSPKADNSKTESSKPATAS